MKIETSYLGLNLPDAWKCSQRDNIWRCNNGMPGLKQKVQMTITAKQNTKGEDLASFERYLLKPKVYRTALGKKTKSKPHSVFRRKIEGYPWVEAFHYGSEAPEYYTHYLATKFENLSILISYSFHSSTLKTADTDYKRVIRAIRLKSSKPQTKAIVAKQPQVQTTTAQAQTETTGFSVGLLETLIGIVGLMIVGAVVYLIKTG